MPRLLALAVLLPALASAAEPPPNFVLFIADDMAWNDCGAYGHPHVRTPHVDALAKAGMRFDNAFLTTSSCSPSRCSIITGRYPHATGAPQLHQPLPGDQVTFVEKLKAAGYYTAAAGKWHLGKETVPKFDKVEQRMNQWVATLEARPKDQPFFLWFAFSDPHRGYQKNTIPRPHTAKDAVVPPFLPDDAATRGDLAMYYDEITRLDGVVGDCVKVLEEQGVSDRTVVVFVSDNGRPFPRCKTTLFDSGIKTPFVVKWPREVHKGSTCDSLVSVVDLAPTFLELAGVELPETFQGTSFAPLLRDPESETRVYVHAEHNWHDFDDHQRAVRDKRYKYVRNSYVDVPLTPPADAVRSPTFQSMLKLRAAGRLNDRQHQCFTTPRPVHELYDLEKDPYELVNVAEDEAYGEILARMSGALDGWIKRTGDAVPEKRRPDGFDRETGERLSK